MDMVIYLARREGVEEMNAMTDLVFETCLAQPKKPFILCASSIHAIDGAYSVDTGVLSLLSERDPDTLSAWPADGFPIPATTASVGELPYTREKRHAENWCQKYAAAGHGAVAARCKQNPPNVIQSPRSPFISVPHTFNAFSAHVGRGRHQSDKVRALATCSRSPPAVWHRSLAIPNERFAR
jgi:nucleoside-diphosphate-sugar epimerase